VNTSEILTRAADLIDERGHCKGRNEDSDGRLCVYGAMREASDAFVDAEYAFGLAAARFSQHIGYDLVALWNDDELRTEEEVLDALRGAAEAARAEQ
jgi:hypothetical protein